MVKTCDGNTESLQTLNRMLGSSPVLSHPYTSKRTHRYSISDGTNFCDPLMSLIRIAVVVIGDIFCSTTVDPSLLPVKAWAGKTKSYHFTFFFSEKGREGRKEERRRRESGKRSGRGKSLQGQLPSAKLSGTPVWILTKYFKLPFFIVDGRSIEDI